ncbi:WD40 repeat domain-containing protein [Nonomuraea endophytica]|uniref:WD40 repeat protein n=1 Tax=Nonomuraea endophytica TaxID=714136 RepID=A0A7W8ACH0_9ACTN|nr:hypothetical protein [Nonomuraea endophytica]MBB5083578.1 WD40 repeat protein [Nonomuraea endophytica]
MNTAARQARTSIRSGLPSTPATAAPAMAAERRRPRTIAAAFAADATLLTRAYTTHESGPIHVGAYAPIAGRGPIELPPSPCALVDPGDGDCLPLLAVSPDGGLVAYGTYRSAEPPARPARLSLWGTRRRRTMDTFAVTEDAARVGSVAFGIDRSTLLIAGDSGGGSLRVWDVPRGRVVGTVPEVAGSSQAVDLGRRLLVTSHGDVVDLRSWTKPFTARIPGVDALAFSPDGRLLATGNKAGRVTVRDSGLTRRLGELSGPSPPSPRQGVTALAFSPDSRTLAVATGTGQVHLWDTASLRPIGSPLLTPGDAILALSFNTEGSTLYAAGEHVPFQRYDISPEANAAAVCRRVTTGLSATALTTHLPGHTFRPTCVPT